MNCPYVVRIFKNKLRAVVTDRLDGTAFFGFLAKRFLFRGGRLFFHERITAALVPVKIVGRCLTAEITVDALRIAIVRARRIVRVLILFIRHDILPACRQAGLN